MLFRKFFFPDESRFFPGQRWVNIGLRTLHLIGMAGMGGGFLYGSLADASMTYLQLTLLSGIGMFALYTWSNGIWLIQLRGVSILAKLVLLAMIFPWPEAKFPLLVAVIVISGLISHAPGDVRYFSIFHGRKVERFP